MTPSPTNFTTTMTPAPTNYTTTTTMTPAPTNFTTITASPAPTNYTTTTMTPTSTPLSTNTTIAPTATSTPGPTNVTVVPTTTGPAPTPTLPPITPPPTPTINPAANILFNATFVPHAYSPSLFTYAVSTQFSVSQSAFSIIYTVPYKSVSRFAQFFFDPTISGYAAAAELAHRLYAQSASNLTGFFGVQTLTGTAMTIPAVNLEFTCQVNSATFDLAIFEGRVELWLGASNGTQLVIDFPLASQRAVAQPIAQQWRRGMDAAPITVIRFHFAGSNAIAEAHRFANQTTQQLSDFDITSLAVSPYVAPTPAPPTPPPTPAPTPPTTLPAPTQTRAYVPSWDNIEFNAIFASQADSSQLQAHVTAWAQVWLGDSTATIQADQIGQSQQSWHFTGPNGTSVGHTFYIQTDSELMDRFGIQNFTISWIVPQPSGFSGADNVEFTLTFSTFVESSFRASLAELLGIGSVDNLDLSITPEQTLVDGAQVVNCNFFGPNAVVNAHQLLAMPQNVLVSLNIISRSASAIAPPPAPENGSSRLKWILIGVGAVIVVAGVCIACALRRKRRLCSCCYSSDDDESDMGTIVGNDDLAAYRRLN
jgi:hypothetical protein